MPPARPLLLLALSLAACAAASPPQAVLVIVEPSLPVASASPPEPDRTCAATLVVQELALERSICSVDTKIQGKRGELTYPCAGGPAEARFPGAVFRGDLVAGDLDVSLTTRFDWDDGCKWGSEQHISGRLSGGALEYAYKEAPLPGQEGCTDSCTARAKVVVRHREER